MCDLCSRGRVRVAVRYQGSEWVVMDNLNNLIDKSELYEYFEPDCLDGDEFDLVIISTKKQIHFVNSSDFDFICEEVKSNGVINR